MSNFWDERYGGHEYAYGTEPNKYFEAQLALIKGKTILLPAEGEGRNAVYAAKNGWNVHAFDASEKAFEKAEALAKRHRVVLNYQVCDVMEYRYKLPNYDVVACIFTHFDPEIRADVFDSLLSKVRKGGFFILEVFSEDQLDYQERYHSGGPQDEEMLFTEDDVRNMLADFYVLDLKKIEVELAEGSYHKGPASVIRCLAKKK
jgi:cyclopropane fatty-acyl-phospholipid synthase-like methyltransferase